MKTLIIILTIATLTGCQTLQSGNETKQDYACTDRFGVKKYSQIELVQCVNGEWVQWFNLRVSE